MCDGKRLLEYGCGNGIESKLWIELGSNLTGIDISEEGINKAKTNMNKNEFEADYYVMNAEETSFGESNFDLVVGSAILHHLDIEKSYKEIARILKPDGHIVFLEPLGHNPLLNLFRKITPKLRTEDEHPLLIDDLKLLDKYFYKNTIEYFTLFTFLAIPFLKLRNFEKILYKLKKIDDYIFNKLPFLQKYSWMCIIHSSFPKK